MSSLVVIHPIFEKCMQYTLDDYWRDVFKSCSENKFPPGIRYNSTTHTLYVKRDAKKATSISLPDDSVDVFKRMMKVFKSDCDMQSSRDLEMQSQDLEDIRKHVTIDLDCEWKKVKPRYLREQLIFEYVGRLKEKHSLSPSEVKRLLATIQLGFQFKQLSAEDIDYENRVINNINGITFDEKSRHFSINRLPRNSSAKNERSAKPTKFVVNCDKFIKEYQKRFRPASIAG